MARIFLSYSGRLGYEMAETVRSWLHQVAGADAWLAPRDLQLGKVWIIELAQKLDKTDRAILCVTRDSVRAAWIHFEAGAAFKGLGTSQVIPYLLDCSPKRVSEPLRIFQAATADHDGTLKLLTDLGLMVTEEVFEKEWPNLERKLRRIRCKSHYWRVAAISCVLLILLVLAGYGWHLKSRSMFPDFEPAVEQPNTANAAPLIVRYRRCDVGSEKCPSGYFYSFDAALFGGYATWIFNRLAPISLQGNQILLRAGFRKGSQTLELGLTDSLGNTAFYDCSSDSAVVVFSAPLNPRELLDARCRINLESIRSFSIGYASVAGKGNHGFDLYDLSLSPDGSAPLASRCEIRRCAE